MIKLDTATLGYIAALENASRVQVKDCIVTDNEIVYIVPEEKLGQAIGKQGAHSKKIGKALGKNVRIIGFNLDPVKFVRNLIYQAEPRSIILEKEDTEKHIIIEADYKTHCSIRGKKSKNLNILRKLLKRHHNVDEIILKQ